MGAGKRRLTMAAVAVVCAMTVLGAPVDAYASQRKPTEPTPSPTPSPSHNAGSPGASGGSSTPDTDPTPVTNEELEAVREKLESLYHDAAVATDAYNAAEEKADRQSEEIVDLAHEVVQGHAKLDKLQDLIGAAAAPSTAAAASRPRCSCG